MTDRRTDVVELIARLNVGGAAQHVLHLGAGLSERRRVLLVTGRIDDGEVEMGGADASGVVRHTIPELGRRIRPWSDLAALIRLVRLLRRTRPYIVHTHTAKAGTLGRLAALMAGVPVRIHTFHGHVLHSYFGRWKTGLFLRIERLLSRVTTRIIAISPSQAEELSGRYGVCARDRIRVIPLGLELERFRPAEIGRHRASFRRELGVSEGQAVVTIVGRLAPIKNHDMFLAVAAALRGRGVDSVFPIVGGGSEEASLRRRAEALGLGDTVRFLGWRDDLERVYAGSDVVVLTSRNEGTPVCLIEALAAGRAVVSTDVGGVRDVLEDGRLGVIVGPDDVERMADAVAYLIGHPAERARLGRAGAESVTRRYALGRMLEDIERLYEEFLPPVRNEAPGRLTSTSMQR